MSNLLILSLYSIWFIAIENSNFLSFCQVITESPKEIFNSQITDNSVKSHNIQDDLPYGFVRDASVDYTSYIQNAISRYDEIIFPGFPLLINDTGLKIGSNKTISFLPGSELRLKPTFKGRYNILSLRNVKNVTLKNPVINGVKAAHLGNEGEWGMGIGIYGSSNITLINPKVYNCWGDGIYIGTENMLPSKNILIQNAFLKGNRRDGISIISVIGLRLENLYAAYSNGTLPMCGINFEPNNPSNELKNIVVTNPRTEYNGGRGIQVGIRMMLGGGDKKIDITIINPVDISAGDNAMKISCKRKSGIIGGSISGTVKIINPTWNKTLSGRPLLMMVDQPNLKTYISSPNVMNSSGKILNPSESIALLNRTVTKGQFILAN